MLEADRLDIEASLAGDEAAYARLVRRYEGEIALQMWRFTRDRSALEELVHDAFVEAYFSLSRFEGRAPFLHWLRRIATRTGYRYWKRQAREKGRQAALEAHQQNLAATRPDPTPSEAADCLYRLLERLPPKDRLVLTLLHLEDCDTAEIARRVGWSRTLVKVRAHRARTKLRGLLEEAGYGRNHHA